MGKSAEILAIGPFNDTIADSLSYDERLYLDTRQGTPVITALFSYMPGNTASDEFARLLGISDPWDFNQHKIDPSHVDLEALKRFFGTLHEGEHYIKDISRFARLRAAGFDFCFLPNG